MDPYNLLQEQLSSINNTLAKLAEDVGQMSRRIDQLERHNASSLTSLDDKLDTIRARVDIVPKIYSNQLATMDMQLIGTQYHYKRMASILGRETEANAFAESQTSNAPGLSSGPNGTDDDDALVVHGGNDHHHHHHHQIMNRGGSQTPSTRLVPQNRVNQNPVNMSLISSENGSTRGTTNSQPNPNSSVTTSSLPRFNIISELNNDQMTLPNLQATGPSDDALSNINDVVEDESRHMWDSVAFNKLNPHPKSVQDVLDEYYFGYQGQPPLKYLEKYRKNWRKGNKNLSKTFCRRYRIVTAVENGVRSYCRDYGLNENVARERIINELEDMRVKDNGKKETMYWLFHHVPQHLKRR